MINPLFLLVLIWIGVCICPLENHESARTVHSSSSSDSSSTVHSSSNSDSSESVHSLSNYDSSSSVHSLSSHLSQLHFISSSSNRDLPSKHVRSKSRDSASKSKIVLFDPNSRKSLRSCLEFSMYQPFCNFLADFELKLETHSTNKREIDVLTLSMHSSQRYALIGTFTLSKLFPDAAMIWNLKMEKIGKIAMFKANTQSPLILSFSKILSQFNVLNTLSKEVKGAIQRSGFQLVYTLERCGIELAGDISALKLTGTIDLEQTMIFVDFYVLQDTFGIVTVLKHAVVLDHAVFGDAPPFLNMLVLTADRYLFFPSKSFSSILKVLDFQFSHNKKIDSDGFAGFQILGTGHFQSGSVDPFMKFLSLFSVSFEFSLLWTESILQCTLKIVPKLDPEPLFWNLFKFRVYIDFDYNYFQFVQRRLSWIVKFRVFGLSLEIDSNYIPDTHRIKFKLNLKKSGIMHLVLKLCLLKEKRILLKPQLH